MRPIELCLIVTTGRRNNQRYIPYLTYDTKLTQSEIRRERYAIPSVGPRMVSAHPRIKSKEGRYSPTVCSTCVAGMILALNQSLTHIFLTMQRLKYCSFVLCCRQQKLLRWPLGNLVPVPLIRCRIFLTSAKPTQHMQTHLHPQPQEERHQLGLLLQLFELHQSLSTHRYRIPMLARFLLFNVRLAVCTCLLDLRHKNSHLTSEM